MRTTFLCFNDEKCRSQKAFGIRRAGRDEKTRVLGGAVRTLLLMRYIKYLYKTAGAASRIIIFDDWKLSTCHHRAVCLYRTHFFPRRLYPCAPPPPRSALNYDAVSGKRITGLGRISAKQSSSYLWLNHCWNNQSRPPEEKVIISVIHLRAIRRLAAPLSPYTFHPWGGGCSFRCKM